MDYRWAFVLIVAACSLNPAWLVINNAAPASRRAARAAQKNEQMRDEEVSPRRLAAREKLPQETPYLEHKEERNIVLNLLSGLLFLD